MRKIGWQSRGARLAGIIAIVVAVGCWFQAAPSTSEVPAPTIRVSTHLVLVDVVVTDKQGKPVTGLHQEDFVVQEKGKNQKVAFFTAPGESQSQASPSASARNLFQQAGIPLAWRAACDFVAGRG